MISLSRNTFERRNGRGGPKGPGERPPKVRNLEGGHYLPSQRFPPLGSRKKKTGRGPGGGGRNEIPEGGTKGGETHRQGGSRSVTTSKKLKRTWETQNGLTRQKLQNKRQMKAGGIFRTGGGGWSIKRVTSTKAVKKEAWGEVGLSGKILWVTIVEGGVPVVLTEDGGKGGRNRKGN